jgi:2-phospho-L-lactate guanylyltransferase (CobY/MobA/RfbA family)
MPTVVVPFRGVEGKSRLGRLPLEARTALAHAMLADVLDACVAVGPTAVVGPEGTPAGEATLVADPGGGQGPAVQAGLDASVAAGGRPPYLVVNADLACVTARDLFALAGAVPDRGLALAAAADGTTNALALSAPDLFEPVYGRGSAARFAALAPSRTVEAPNLIDDVDTLADLERLAVRVGSRTKSVLATLRLGEAA